MSVGYNSLLKYFGLTAIKDEVEKRKIGELILELMGELMMKLAFEGLKKDDYDMWQKMAEQNSKTGEAVISLQKKIPDFDSKLKTEINKLISEAGQLT